MELKKIRIKTGLSQKDFAKMIGCPANTYNQWETGKRTPDLDTIKHICKILNISADEIIGTNKNNIVPVLGKVAAGIPIEAVTDIIDYEELDPNLIKDNAEYFALQIKGQSMEPRILNGDVVIVRKQPDCNSGQIAIVYINGDEATCKKIVKQKNGISLVPLNPQYDTIFYSNKEIKEKPVTILGIVIELRAKFN